MGSSDRFNPNAPNPIEAMLGARIHALFRKSMLGARIQALFKNRNSAQSAQITNPELITRAPALIEIARWLTAHPKINSFQDALADCDELALARLAELDAYVSSACSSLLERCQRWTREQEWTALRDEAALAERLAAAIGQDASRASASYFLALAHRAHGNTMGVIFAYENCIASATRAGNVQLLALANDNLGNALLDAGRLDAAVIRYKEALQYERSLVGRRTILMNFARALTGLGELRSAARLHHQVVTELEQTGVDSRQLALALDNAAITINELGEPETALAMLDRARSLLKSAAPIDRAINALIRSIVHRDLSNEDATRNAFMEAHDLVFEEARKSIDVEHYRRGFIQGRAHRLLPDHEANSLFLGAVDAHLAGSWELARERAQLCSQRAQAAGDHLLALRADANIVAVLMDEGKVGDAVSVAQRVRHEASRRGYARLESMAVANLASLSAQGAEISEGAGPLGLLARSITLMQVDREVESAADPDPVFALIETQDTGMEANQLAFLAQNHKAYALAINYYREAIARARELGTVGQLVNRLAGLRYVLIISGRLEQAEDTATELGALLDRGDLPDHARIVGHRALAHHLVERDRPSAIEHLRRACAFAEELRKEVAPGADRADVLRQYLGIYRFLARLLREAGDDVASFEALQGEKGRRLIATLAASVGAGTDVADVPPSAGEVISLLDAIGQDAPTELIDLTIGHEGLTAYLVSSRGVRSVYVAGATSRLVIEGGDVRERQRRSIELCQREPILSTLVEAVMSAVPEGRRLLVVPDVNLENLPLHAIPLRGRPWCDHAPIGYLPAAGLLRFTQTQRSVIGRALVAGDSRGDLPYAADECRAVAALLKSDPLIGPQCTRSAIEESLAAGALDVVHLAVHGRGDVRRGGRASLLLADGHGSTEWVAFDELVSWRWRASLVVLSGCSTAVAGRRQGGGQLVGVARAAAEAGAGAVIACLWPVDDRAAAVCMTAFYEALTRRRIGGPVDLRVVLDEARAALRERLDARPSAQGPLRDGRELVPDEVSAVEPSAVDAPVAGALAWAPFVLLGDPILHGW